jgi:hypothetical protein
MRHYALDQLDKTSVSAALWLTDPKEKVTNGILTKMTPSQRSRMVSPISARQRVKAWIAAQFSVGETVEEGAKPLSKLKQMEQSLAKALQEKHQLEEQLKRSDVSLFDMPLTPAKEVAPVLAAHWSENKWREVKKATDALYQRKRQKPAG